MSTQTVDPLYRIFLVEEVVVGFLTLHPSVVHLDSAVLQYRQAAGMTSIV